MSDQELIRRASVEVLRKALAMREAGISVLPAPNFALADSGGVPRLTIPDVVETVLLALRDSGELKPGATRNPEEET